MKDKLVKHIETLFQPYEKTEELIEFKSEILLNLMDRYNDYLEEGLSQEDAFDRTIQSIGDMEQLISENQGDVEAASRTLLINFSASNLKEGDFRNESIVGGAFNASNLKGANFSNTKIEDSNFNSSDLNGVVFNHAKIKNVSFKSSDVRNVQFNSAVMDKVIFYASSLDHAEFADTIITNTELKMMDFKTVNFSGCRFNNVVIYYSDLTGVSFDGQVFDSVKFEKTMLTNASFRSTTLRNVSFCTLNTITKKFYKAIKTIDFTDAKMDKLTYAALKGLDADLSNVTLL